MFVFARALSLSGQVCIYKLITLHTEMLLYRPWSVGIQSGLVWSTQQLGRHMLVDTVWLLSFALHEASFLCTLYCPWFSALALVLRMNASTVLIIRQQDTIWLRAVENEIQKTGKISKVDLMCHNFL